MNNNNIKNLKRTLRKNQTNAENFLWYYLRNRQICGLKFRRQGKKLEQGFTLIEFLMYIGIFSILLVALFQLFTTILDIQSESQATSSVDEDGKFILSRLSYDIQRTNAIVTPASVGQQGSTLQLTIGGASYTYTT